MIPISSPSLGPLEREYLLDAFDSTWISSLGKYIDRAESSLTNLSKSKFCAVASSGTTSLHLAILALDLHPGDEVIMPSLSYVATMNAVMYVGATPVLVDVDPNTWCVSPESVAGAITSKTRAIIAVDLYGNPADYTALRAIAAAHSLYLVADAAESIGASVAGQPVGSLADITTFSFFGNKTITSGEGGAVLTSNADLDSRIRQLRNQGNHRETRYFHDILGYNYRMTNLSAAILCAQIERLPELSAQRSRVLGWYSERLDSADRIITQVASPASVQSPWMFTVLVEGYQQEQRDDLIESMKSGGVETRPMFKPMQTMPYFKAVVDSPTAVTNRLAGSGISLPTFAELTEQEVDKICSLLLGSLD